MPFKSIFTCEMKTLLIISLMVFIKINSVNAQDKFEYYFSEEVNGIINQTLSDKQKEDETSEFYLKVLNMEDNEYGLFVLKLGDNTSEGVKRLVELSNRYVKIENYYLPIIFEEDFTFGVFGRTQFGIGIVRKASISEGPYIRVNNGGEVVEQK